MERVWIITYMHYINNNINEKSVRINMYPSHNPEVNSLRLFGSNHIRNKVFSYICTKDRGVLDEYDSWLYFEDYMKNKTITREQFDSAYEQIKKLSGKTA